MRNIVAHAALEPEVKHAGHVAVGGVIAEQLLVAGKDFAKDKELGFACGCGMVKDGRRELRARTRR